MISEKEVEEKVIFNEKNSNSTKGPAFVEFDFFVGELSEEKFIFNEEKITTNEEKNHSQRMRRPSLNIEFDQKHLKTIFHD